VFDGYIEQFQELFKVRGLVSCEVFIDVLKKHQINIDKIKFNEYARWVYENQHVHQYRISEFKIYKQDEFVHNRIRKYMFHFFSKDEEPGLLTHILWNKLLIAYNHYDSKEKTLEEFYESMAPYIDVFLPLKSSQTMEGLLTLTQTWSNLSPLIIKPSLGQATEPSPKKGKVHHKNKSVIDCGKLINNANGEEKHSHCIDFLECLNEESLRYLQDTIFSVNIRKVHTSSMHRIIQEEIQLIKHEATERVHQLKRETSSTSKSIIGLIDPKDSTLPRVNFEDDFCRYQKAAPFLCSILKSAARSDFHHTHLERLRRECNMLLSEEEVSARRQKFAHAEAIEVIILVIVLYSVSYVYHISVSCLCDIERSALFDDRAAHKWVLSLKRSHRTWNVVINYITGTWFNGPLS
jgi:hypothetical protein